MITLGLLFRRSLHVLRHWHRPVTVARYVAWGVVPVRVLFVGCDCGQIWRDDLVAEGLMLPDHFRMMFCDHQWDIQAGGLMRCLHCPATSYAAIPLPSQTVRE